jgi:exopolysaccharide biosynthesis polyprenyl glycosylphosphotransferase
MLREQSRLINRIAFVVNTLVIAGAFVLAYALRQQFSPELLPFTYYAWVLLVILPVWLYLLTKYQLFSSLRYVSPFELCRNLGAIHFWGGVILAAAIFFIDRQTFSRGLLGFFLLNSFVLLFALHWSRRMVLGMLRRKGYNFRKLLIVGTGDDAGHFLKLIEEHRDWGLRVAGFVGVGDLPSAPAISGYPVMGQIGDLVDICKRHPVDEIIFCLPRESFFAAEQYVLALEELGITSRMVLNLCEEARSRREISFFHGEIPILTFYPKSFDAGQLFLKRILDVAGATVGLAILAVLLPFAALAIKLDSPGPVFFGQERIGLNGRIFRCWKLRSMYADAEARKQELLARNEMQGAIFKISDDPRITRVGSFLRKSSLDEFPQFWNVLKGEMSLVGTRPPTPDEVAQYENWHRRRISIKPGLTGLWQVSGRSQISDFDEIVRLDIEYIERWSLWLDLKILLKTCWVVCAVRGAS